MNSEGLEIKPIPKEAPHLGEQPDGTFRVALDRETHTYSNGLPSVTQILQAAGIIDTQWFTDEARDRGTAVHAACEYYDQGELDESSVDPAIAGYLDAYKSWQALNGRDCTWIERSVSDQRKLYAGTPDRILTTQPRAVVDIKTGQPQDWHRLQLAAYVNCLHDPFSYQRIGLYLRSDGEFSVVKYELKNYTNDLAVFMAAVKIYYWKKGN